MNRLLRSISKAKRAYRLLAWASAMFTTVGVPLLGYLSQWASLTGSKRDLMEDNPELASSQTMPGVWEWLTTEAGGTVGHVMLIVAVCGILLLAVLAVFRLLAFLVAGTGVEDAVNTADSSEPEGGETDSAEEDDDEYGFAG